MKGVALRVRKPLPRRLLKRVLLFSAMLIVLLAGARAWWEYRVTLAAVHEEFADIESTKAKSVAASLWDFDREQLALHVEGIRHFRYITYAGVRDAEGVVAQSGVRRGTGVLDREFPLSVVYNGQRQELGALHVQADLESLRQAAWRTAWLVLAFNAALVLLVAGLMVWLTNDMISRHLGVFAAHLGSFSLGGEYRPLILDKRPVGDELDMLASALNTMQDGLVSSYRQVLEAQAEVRRSLQEKEILLKEIHHRVKNNLQIISSLLFLQAEYVLEPQDRAMFEESQKRIAAMALVHEELYGSSDLASVDMGDYVPRLVGRVVAGSDSSVHLAFDVEDMRLPVTQSIPCGLVLNEMVMNAVKHAFKSGREGRLRVSLLRRGGQAELAVEDNGPGLPPDFNMESPTTLGLTLITSLARQLFGTVVAESLETGARFVLLFPVEIL